MGIQELVLGCRAPSSLLCAALQCSRTRAENSSIVSFKTFWRLEQAVEAFFFLFFAPDSARAAAADGSRPGCLHGVSIECVHSVECVLYRMCLGVAIDLGAGTVFSIECVLYKMCSYRMCSVKNVFAIDCALGWQSTVLYRMCYL